jgi:CysZ protein
VFFPIITGFLYVLIHQFSGLVTRWLPQDGGAWYTTPLSYLLITLSIVAGILASAFAYTALGRLFIVPFGEIICARTETVLNIHDAPELTWSQSLRDLPRLFKVELLKLMFALLILGTTMFFSLVAPPIAVALTPLNCWFIAFESVDYVHERRRHAFSARLKWAVQRWIPLTCFGVLLLFLTGIPIVGIMVLPAGVVGGTLLYHYLEKGVRV